MSDLKKEYDQITKQREEVMKELKLLEQDETVKRFLRLKEQNVELQGQQQSLYWVIKQQEYTSCNHVLVYSKMDRDSIGDITYKRCGCIKCGLDNSVLDYNRENLTLDKRIMHYHLMITCFRGRHTEISCDLDLARAIYARIKEVHPDIDDKTALKYFEIALDDIRNIKVNEKRKTSRAKRLALSPDFKKWNANDICSY